MNLNLDIAEWGLLVMVAVGLAWFVIGVRNLIDITQGGDLLNRRDFKYLMNELSSWQRFKLWASLTFGSLIFIGSWVVLIMYGWEKYYQ